MPLEFIFLALKLFSNPHFRADTPNFARFNRELIRIHPDMQLSSMYEKLVQQVHRGGCSTSLSKSLRDGKSLESSTLSPTWIVQPAGRVDNIGSPHCQLKNSISSLPTMICIDTTATAATSIGLQCYLCCST